MDSYFRVYPIEEITYMHVSVCNKQYIILVCPECKYVHFEVRFEHRAGECSSAILASGRETSGLANRAL